MAAESRVQQLLDEISDSGCIPEEVCGDCPGSFRPNQGLQRGLPLPRRPLRSLG
jgi:hypothetical protein